MGAFCPTTEMRDASAVLVVPAHVIGVEATHALSYWFLSRTYAADGGPPMPVADAVKRQSPAIQELWEQGRELKEHGGEAATYVGKLCTLIAE